MELDAASSCESAVDMVDARIPDRTTPAISAGRTPWVASSFAISTMMVSDWLPPRLGIAPAAVIPRPTIPMKIATLIEITTHTDAIRLESFSFLSSPIAMKRSRICGIPK